MSRWILRVDYYKWTGSRRTKTYRGYDRKYEVYGLKADILKRGLMRNDYREHADPKDVYEYWVAPSQIIGFEIIEMDERGGDTMEIKRDVELLKQVYDFGNGFKIAIVSDDVVKGAVYMIPPRRCDGGQPEPLEDWGRRCAVMINISGRHPSAMRRIRNWLRLLTKGEQDAR